MTLGCTLGGAASVAEMMATGFRILNSAKLCFAIIDDTCLSSFVYSRFHSHLGGLQRHSVKVESSIAHFLRDGIHYKQLRGESAVIGIES